MVGRSKVYETSKVYLPELLERVSARKLQEAADIDLRLLIYNGIIIKKLVRYVDVILLLCPKPVPLIL